MVLFGPRMPNIEKLLNPICLLNFEAKRKCCSHLSWQQANCYTCVLDTSKIVISAASCQCIVGLSSLSLNSRLLNELIMYIFFDNNFESFQYKICNK